MQNHFEYAAVKVIRVHTGKIAYNSRTFQGFLKDFPTNFKDLKLKKNTDSHVKILLLKCSSPFLKILV